jgi:hypothetical protein
MALEAQICTRQDSSCTPQTSMGAVGTAACTELKVAAPQGQWGGEAWHNMMLLVIRQGGDTSRAWSVNFMGSIG